MNLCCCLCRKVQDEQAFTIHLRGKNILLSFCATCRENHDEESGQFTPRQLSGYNRRMKVTKFCPHGKSIRSSRPDAVGSPDCQKCQRSYYDRRRAKSNVHSG